MPPVTADARRPLVRRIRLADFRSYPTLDVSTDRPVVVLTGDNGTGKTNLLESLSLFTPGRGLRRADGTELARRDGAGGWAASIELSEAPDEEARRLGTGTELADGATTRRCRIDGAPASSARAFAEHLRIVWLTPAMDALFTGPASERRRFLDRIVLTVDPDHAARVSALDRALRNRNRILEEGRTGSLDRAWAEAAEREVASLGVAVAAARHDAVARLSALIAATLDEASPFPWAALALGGEVEEMLSSLPAVDVEDRYRDLLRANRARDAAAGRTTVGPHVGDLSVWHGPKGVEAAQASTGEQKALVVGLVLAQARLVATLSGLAPLVLLDEIAAHFDPSRRRALFDQARTLGGQVFMTGADPAAFADVGGDALRLRVEAGRVTPG